MKELKTVTINNTDISIKEYQGKRVVTLKEIDQCHGRPDGTARKRFNDNKTHFIEGVDYFKTKCSEVRPFFGQTLPNGFNPNGDITLITESGYLMLVKSFTDDLAWNVQRQLVNSYFRVEQTKGNETLKLQIQQERSKAMLLNAQNQKAKILMQVWGAARVEPQYQALGINNLYGEASLPRIALKEQATALFDLTTIAKHLGVMSKSGKPHAQAIGAIVEKLKPLDDDEWAMTPYSRNGHDDQSIQYTESVEKKVANWLTENNFPNPIIGKDKKFTVKYDTCTV